MRSRMHRFQFFIMYPWPLRLPRFGISESVYGLLSSLDSAFRGSNLWRFWAPRKILVWESVWAVKCVVLIRCFFNWVYPFTDSLICHLVAVKHNWMVADGNFNGDHGAMLGDQSFCWGFERFNLGCRYLDMCWMSLVYKRWLYVMLLAAGVGTALFWSHSSVRLSCLYTVYSNPSFFSSEVII
jgi:hypothetical protein